MALWRVTTDVRYSITLNSESKKITIILLGAILFCVYCFVFGQSGVMERSRLEKEKEALALEIAYLERENGRLESLYSKYVAGERAPSECENAGFIKSGDKILFFNQQKKMIRNRDSVKENIMSLETMRIVWVVLSVMVILLYCGLMYFKHKSDVIIEPTSEDQ